MSGIDEQVKCQCGSRVFIFGTTNPNVCPYDIAYSRGDVHVVHMREVYTTKKVKPIKNNVLALTCIKYLYTEMSDKRWRSYVWSCPECNMNYNKRTPIYGELVRAVGERLDERY